MTIANLNLESLKLSCGAHSSPQAGMCVMEAVAFVAGEPFSDHPECACPIISTFLRFYNDAVSDEVRQTLKPFIPRLVGSRGTRVEERRALMAADWLVRVHTPAWLRLAGLNSYAFMLSTLPEITSLAQVPSILGAIDAARKGADAAWDAAWAAASNAASNAAWDASWEAARAAAGAAAGDAAWAAARAAAGDAAWDAAREAAWARAAAGAAAGEAAREAAGNAAREALAPTVIELQATVPDLIEALLAVA